MLHSQQDNCARSFKKVNDMKHTQKGGIVLDLKGPKTRPILEPWLDSELILL